eukprot:scpid79964/ scgid13404/ 
MARCDQLSREMMTRFIQNFECKAYPTPPLMPHWRHEDSGNPNDQFVKIACHISSIGSNAPLQNSCLPDIQELKRQNQNMLGPLQEKRMEGDRKWLFMMPSLLNLTAGTQLAG